MKLRNLMAIGMLAAHFNLFAQGTAFTYQGRLSSGTTGVTGLFDFRLAAFDAASAGSQVGSTVNVTAVGVTNGLFTVTLDFGANVFSGASRFLDLAARTNGSGATFVSMTPRQLLTPAPYAVLAASANTLAGSFSGDVTGTQGATVVQAVAGYSGAVLVSGAAAANAAGSQNYPGTIVKRDGLGNFSAGNMNGSFTGNGAGITNLPTSGLAGTISSSQIAAGAVGAAQLNASAPSSGQVLTYNGSGLAWNTPAAASGAWSLTGNAGTTPGANFIGTTDNQPLELRANNVRGLRIESGNISARAQHIGFFNPNGAPSVIGGSPNNFIGPNVIGAFIGGGGATNFIGNAYTNSIFSDWGVIGGGTGNRIESLDNSLAGIGSVIGGGSGNVIQHNAQGAFIGGGTANTIHTNSYESIIVGGLDQDVTGFNSFIGGGGYDGHTFSGNTVTGNVSSVVGGLGNIVSANSAFIGGGVSNTVSSVSGVVAGGELNQATAFRDVVGGGLQNTASGGISTVAGGWQNTASGNGANIGGGTYNTNNGNIGTIAGGQNNLIAGNYQPSIGGGYGNAANGNYSTVPGGYGNVAGSDFSLAAGHFAKATNSGAFVWADNQGSDFGSTANNQFSVRANGGARFVTGGAGLTVDGNTVLTTSSGTNGVTIQQNVAGSPSVILGSAVNHAASGVSGATVGGGGSSGLHYTNSATADFATVGGGAKNTASGVYSVVSGGQNNTASDDYSSVLGGQNNTASGLNSAVLNGIFNNASGDYSLAAGANATASGIFSVIIGGQHNTASGQSSVVLGGDYNTATGTYSLAAGQHAHAVHNGAFVWADTQGSDFGSSANNQFSVRANGGVVFDNTPETSISVFNILGGFSVNGTTRLQAANTVTLTNSGAFKNIGDANITGKLSVNASAGNLIMQGENGVAMSIAAAGGPNSGHVRFRNALEIFPASDASAPGTLDVRDTNGFATITLRGDTGSLSATNISTVGNATIGGNLSANNTPGVNYSQASYLSESISFPGNSTVNIASEGNAKVAPGFFLISASVTGLGVGNLVELDLLDVSGTPTVLTSCSTETDVSGTKSGAFSLSLNWVVPISAANGYQNFGIRVKSIGGNSGGVINGHNLSVLYVPRQNN